MLVMEIMLVSKFEFIIYMPLLYIMASVFSGSLSIEGVDSRPWL